MSEPVLAVLLTLASGLVGGLVTSWLTGREKAALEARTMRLGAYPVLWRRSSTLSLWPRTNATYDDLRLLHLDARRWYYEVGGISMSSRARARYGELQELVGAILDRHADDLSAPLADSDYTLLEDSGSALRSALTNDLETRRLRSPLWAFTTWRQARRAKAKSLARTRKLGAAPPRLRTIRYELAEQDRTLAIEATEVSAAAPTS